MSQSGDNNLYNVISSKSMSTDEIIDPYNILNKLITKEDLKRMFKKFNLEIEPENINLYIKSLTHKSYIKKEYYDSCLDQSSRSKTTDTLELLDESNETLEFLGDTVIKCVVSGYLYLRYHKRENEGFMTRLKTKIENRESLAKFAKILGIDEYMIISKQIEDNNGRNSDKLLEDSFESFVGALYLDIGFEVCRKFMYIILETEIDYAEILYKDTNYKDQLLKFFHQNKWSYPQYVQLEVEGPPHKRIFIIGVKDYRDEIIAKAKAYSKQKAEQYASMIALYNYKVINEDQLIAMEL